MSSDQIVLHLQKRKVGPAYRSDTPADSTKLVADDKSTEVRPNASNEWLRSTGTGCHVQQGVDSSHNLCLTPVWSPEDANVNTLDLPVASQALAESQYKPKFEEIGVQWSDETIRAASGQTLDGGSREYRLNVTYPVSSASDGPDQISSASSASRILGTLRSPVASPMLSVDRPSDIGLKLNECSDFHSEGPSLNVDKTEAVCIVLYIYSTNVSSV